MNNLDLTCIEDLVTTCDTNGNKQTTVMYIAYEENEDTSYEDRKDLRDLKVGELIDDEDNSEEIQEIESKLETRGTWGNMAGNNPQMSIISPSIKTLVVNLKDCKIVNDNEYLPTLVNDLREDILDEIYKISSYNHKSTSQKIPDLNFNESEASDMNIVSRRVLGRMLACGNYIAVEGRIGPANTVIMHPKFTQLLHNNLSSFSLPVTGNNNNPYKIGNFSGMDIITDNRLGDKIVCFRKSSDMTQINDNLVFFYDYNNGKLDYKIQQVEDCVTNYIEFHINGLDI